MCPSTYPQLPSSSQQICTSVRHVKLRCIIWVNSKEYEQLIPGYGPNEEMHFGPQECRYRRIREGRMSWFFSDYMISFNLNNLPRNIFEFPLFKTCWRVGKASKILHSSSRQRSIQGTLSTSVRNRIERNPALTATAKQIIWGLCHSQCSTTPLKTVLAFSPLNVLSLEHKSICENKKKKKSPRKNESVEFSFPKSLKEYNLNLEQRKLTSTTRFIPTDLYYCITTSCT